MMTIGGGVFLILLLVGTFFIASRPKMSLLFGGLSPAQQGSVVTELEKLGINTDFNERGDVLVASDQVANARMKLASENKLPTTVGFGDDELKSLGVMETPAVERERLKSILESKLENSIDSIDGIESSRVQIALGDTSSFVREQQPATASVTITERGDSEINKEQGRTIALLVANSVPGLQMDSIAVLDSRMNLLYDGKGNSSVSGLVSEKLQTQQSEEERRARELQGILDQVYGPQSAIVKVNLSLDFDHQQYTQETHIPSEKLETGKQTETMSGNSANPIGLAGATSNLNGQAGGAPGTPSGVAGGAKYTMTKSENGYEVDTKNTTMELAAGSLKSMTIDVIANSDKVKDVVQLQSILDGYLGAHLNTAGFTDKVTLVKFDTSQATTVLAAAKSQAMSQRIQQIISILPILALIFLGFIVMKQLSKFARTGNGFALPRPNSGMMALGPGGEMSNHGGNHLRPVKTPEGLELAVRNASASHDDEGSSIDVGHIQTKVNVPLEQIKKMSDKRPEAVAMLIKGWLMEERT